MNKVNTKFMNDGLMGDMFELQVPPEANLQLADPQLVIDYKNSSRRILWIDKDIDDSLYAEMRQIILWNIEDEEAKIPVEQRKPIVLIIHSYGGAIDAAFSLMDLISKSKTIVKTINFGSSMSAGCLLLLSGTKGYRYCMPLSTALIHEGQGGTSGSYDQVQSQNANYKHIMDTMKQWIMDHTEIDTKTMAKWKNKEIYLYAEDQVKYGVVDAVIDNLFDVIK